jgi:hypothetical protein
MDGTFNVTLQGITGQTTTNSNTISSIPDSTHFQIGQVVSGIGIPAGTQVIAIPSGTQIVLNTKCTSTGITTILLDGGHTLVLNDLTNIEIGDLVYQNDTRYSIIGAISLDNHTVTVREAILDWVLGPSQIVKAFESNVQYVPQTAQNPGSLKQFREASLLMQVPNFNQVTLGFSTDLSSGIEEIPLFGLYGTAWGRFKWGKMPWGGVMKSEPLRTYVPQQKQRCSQLNVFLKHREAYAFYRLNGISFVHNSPSERVGI